MRVIGLEQTVYDVREDMGGVVVCVSRWGDTGCLESNFSITLRTVATSAGIVQKTDAMALSLVYYHLINRLYHSCIPYGV